MSELNKKIERFLAQDKMSFVEGMLLYSQHESCKKNRLQAMEQRKKHKSAHEKLVYELEFCIGAKESGRATSLTEAIENKPHLIIKEASQIAPENYEYETPLEDLPEELKSLAIQKGQLYRENEVLKAQNGAIAEKNDEDSVQLKLNNLNKIRANVEQIKAFHETLMVYKAPAVVEVPEVAKVEGTGDETKVETKENSVPAGVKVEETKEEQKEEKAEEKEASVVPELSWSEKKNLLKKTQSSVRKQLIRSQESLKEETRLANALKAEKGQKLIDELQLYFKENPKPPA